MNHLQIDVNTLVGGLILLLIGYAIKTQGKKFEKLFDHVDAIEKHLAQLNGRTGRIEEWKRNHSDEANRMYSDVNKRIDEVREQQKQSQIQTLLKLHKQERAD